MDLAAPPFSAPATARWQVGALFASAEKVLEAERAQTATWCVVGVGAGIAAWLVVGDPSRWLALAIVLGGTSFAGAVLGGRTGRALALFAGAMLLGLSLIWWRSLAVAAPRLAEVRIVEFTAAVEKVERLVARDSVRLTLLPAHQSNLPPRIRVSVPLEQTDRLGATLGAGASVSLKARLTPPMSMVLPGGYDFARNAWFAGIGGTGRALGEIRILAPAQAGGLDRIRAGLDRHIRASLPPREAGIAVALANGDQGSIAEEDAEAMRRSGLAHLLSVSGLHIAAAVGFAYFLLLRTLALGPWLALRVNLVLVALAGGALVGIAYTVMTGLQVPTIRSCIAALLVLVGVALGREALSLRLIATAALVILLLWPESLAGASFQLSFAAVTALVTLYSSALYRKWFERREEGFAEARLRAFGAMIATGLAVELALMPIALYHFHRAGLYGVAANLLAIPLTTFVIMPLEAMALLFDMVGLGAPFWALAGWSIGILLDIAHGVAATAGAVAILPAMPRSAYGLIIAGLLWLSLWRTRWRWWGGAPVLAGIAMTIAEPLPDLLVTGDGRHLAVVDPGGTPWLLRERAGDFVRDTMAENAGFDGDPPPLAAYPKARCSADSCVADIGDQKVRTLLAIRSTQRIDWRELVAACQSADIVVAERRLPRACRARWLTLDLPRLRETGGIIVRADGREVETVADRLGSLPWARPESRQQARFRPDR